MAFAKAQPQFAEKGAQLLGLSIDSNPSHLAWVYACKLGTGGSGLDPAPEDLRSDDGAAQELYCEDWFWCYRQLPAKNGELKE